MKLAAACLVLLACGGGGSTDDPQPGAFTLQWAITLDGVAATCADVAGISVSVTIDELATNTFDFPCDDGDGATGAQEPGTHQVLVELLAGDQSTLSSFAPIEATIIDGPADLGDFTFSVGTACDASTCATGCCDENGDCVDPQSDMACGRGGATCTNCETLGQVCNTTEGTCIE